MKSMSREAIFFLFILLALSTGIIKAAGENPGSRWDRQNGLLPPGFIDSVKTDSSARETVKVKSPRGALLRALALPGWGQFYTGHHIRGSVTAVLETTFFAAAFVNYRDRNRLRDELRLLEKENGEPGAEDESDRVEELNRRIKSHQLRAGDYLAYGVTTLLLSLIDSYVSAHLYRFETNFQVSSRGTVEVSFKF